MDTKCTKEKETCLVSNVNFSVTSKTQEWTLLPKQYGRSHQDGESPHGSHPVHSALHQDSCQSEALALQLI